MVIPAMTMTIIRTYSELKQFKTFKDRFEYLKLTGEVGKATFGFDRYFNQRFYQSLEWKQLRHQVIVRDDGCDLGIPGYDIPKGVSIYIHHLNPLQIEDISNVTEYLLNPEYLITTTFRTHNAIHYGDISQLEVEVIERRPNDTCPWKNN